MKILDQPQELKRLLKESDYLNCFSFPVEKLVKLIRCEADDFITREGEEPAYLYYLVSGKVKLFLTLPNGKVTLIDFFDAPCFIGEMELLGVNPQSRAVQALIPCTCLALPLEACKAQLLEDARFLRILCTYLGTKNTRNVSSLAETKGYPLANRLAAFLLLASAGGSYKEPHTNAAEYLGVSYRHLLYVLAQFTEQGILEKTINGYKIKDRKALVRLASEMDSRSSGHNLLGI